MNISGRGGRGYGAPRAEDESATGLAYVDELVAGGVNLGGRPEREQVRVDVPEQAGTRSGSRSSMAVPTRSIGVHVTTPRSY